MTEEIKEDKQAEQEYVPDYSRIDKAHAEWVAKQHERWGKIKKRFKIWSKGP